VIIKLRTNSHELHSEVGRWTIPKEPWDRRICKLCNLNAIEYETHFLLIFSLYKNIRQTCNDICNYNLIYEFLNQGNQNKLGDFIKHLNFVRNNYFNIKSIYIYFGKTMIGTTNN